LWLYIQRKRRRDGIPFSWGVCLRRLCGNQLCWMQPLMNASAPPMNASIKIGTRGSKLALWQANWVKSVLNQKFPHQTLELVTIKTQGDKILDVPLANVGGKGLFVKEIEQALLDRRVDIAVHSMKDMPADIPEGLYIGAVPQREIPTDVLISRKGLRFSQLKSGSVIGTSSLRRAAQFRHARADIFIRPLRGNLDTRLRKLESEDMDAIVVAAAGVKRLNLEDRISEYLDEDLMLPAVGQGALCIEIRENNPAIEKMVSALDHLQPRAIVTGERAFLNRLEGGCQIPIAGHGKIVKNRYTLTGLVADVDGSCLIKDTLAGLADSSEHIGTRLAEQLLAKGADKILAKLKSESIQ
jgi:hydroxymethylbilane synthase